MLSDLLSTGKPAAQKDDMELQEFAKTRFSHTEVQPWDRPFFVEKLRKDRYGIDAEALRSYFAYPKASCSLPLAGTRVGARCSWSAGSGQVMWRRRTQRAGRACVAGGESLVGIAAAGVWLAGRGRI